MLPTAGAHFSSDAVELAGLHNVDLVFLDRHGDPFARVWHTKMGSTPVLDRRKRR